MTFQSVLLLVCSFGSLCFTASLAVMHLVARSLYRLATAKKDEVGGKRPSLLTPMERFENLKGYPFKPNYYTFEGLKVHYVDEGDKNSEDTIVLLHGEPTWSFLYRKMIPLLADDNRVIALDWIGCGKSEKLISKDDYTMTFLMDSLKELFKTLDLKNVVLVVQDWGGLLGLSTIEFVDERIQSVVIMNTGLPPAGKSSLQANLNFANWAAFAALCDVYLPVSFVIGLDVKGLTAEDKAAYDAPFPTSKYKALVAKFPLMVPIHPSWDNARHTTRAVSFLKSWTKPSLIMFSDKDFITREHGDFFEHIMKNPDRVFIQGAGHFLQESKAPCLSNHILEFIKKHKH